MASGQNNGTSVVLAHRFGWSPESDVRTLNSSSIRFEPTIPDPDSEKIIAVRSDNAFINNLDAQFPPDEHTWIKDLERRPEQALKKSYIHGVPQQEVMPSAPTLKVGITFLSGADIATVTRSEQSAMMTNDAPPYQQTAQWRVYTAATLLFKIEVDENLRVKKGDISERIVNKRKALPLTPTRSSSESSKHSAKVHSRKDSTTDPASEIVRREKRHHPLTIDSDEVKLFHNIPQHNEDFDVTATLVEVDMLSMKALIENYNKIISDTGKQMSQAETVGVLDTMIADVRRLCARSPRLFRMSTRSVIAESEDVRYGVDFGSLFTTVTTSEGIRHLIDRGSGYYQSLSDDKIDQGYVRPRFLQMLVLLLSMLNNTDLALISKFIESTYQIPGDRTHLELLIMKVLPLQSINSEIFFRSFHAAYKPKDPPKGSYQLRVQDELWKELQRDIARRGFVVPSISKESVPAGISNDAQGLEDGWGSDSDEDDAPRATGTWIPDPPHGLEGLKSSAIFKYLQHDGKLRAQGQGADGSVRAINEIPHLETASDDIDSRVTILFRNNDSFMVYPEDAEKIQTMTPNVYPLEPVQSGFLSAELEIMAEPLNEPFIKATNQVNQLLKVIRDVLGSRTSQARSLLDRIGLSGQGPNVHLADIDAPAEAARVTATIKLPGMDGLDQDKILVAVAFKIANRVVFRHYILKAMTDNLNKLRHAVKWVETQKTKMQGMKTRDSQEADYVRKTIKSCNQDLIDIRELLDVAEKEKRRVHNMEHFGETDPIERIQLPAFNLNHGELPDWQDYESALDKSSDLMRLKARKFIVDSVVPDVQGTYSKASFRGVELELLIEPLSFGGVHDKDLVLAKNMIVAWIGHYLVVLEELDEEVYGRYAHAVQGYFRLLAQTYVGTGSKKNVLRTWKQSRIGIV